MAKYEVGQVVQHLRYDYRGVIVQIDRVCCASNSWYERNKTHPTRNQPWYHILVDGGSQTYVAEENISLDSITDEVVHPYVSRIFSVFINGRYHRFSPN